jgi:hypothetical protein
LDEAPYKLSRAIAKLASITFTSLAFSYWIDRPWFLTEGKLAAVLITPSLGVPNWSVIYIINTAPPVVDKNNHLSKQFFISILQMKSSSTC